MCLTSQHNNASTCSSDRVGCVPFLESISPLPSNACNCHIIVCQIVPYSGKFLRVQTFANSPSEAPEEIFTVLIFAIKPCLAQYQLGC